MGFDNFTSGMAKNEAIDHLNSAFVWDTIGHNHSGSGMGGPIAGSSIIGSVSGALNVSSYINGIPISSILELNGTTVKLATSAQHTPVATNVSGSINGVLLTSIFESNYTTVKNSTNAVSAINSQTAFSATNTTNLNNLSASYYQNFYNLSENILLEKLPQDSVTDGSTIVALLTIYTPGMYNVSCDIKINNSAHTATVDFLWFNHISLYSSSTQSESYTTKSSDIFIPVGKLYVKLTATTVNPQMNGYGTAYIRNIRLKGQISTVPALSIS